MHVHGKAMQGQQTISLARQRTCLAVECLEAGSELAVGCMSKTSGQQQQIKYVHGKAIQDCRVVAWQGIPVRGRAV